MSSHTYSYIRVVHIILLRNKSNQPTNRSSGRGLDVLVRPAADERRRGGLLLLGPMSIGKKEDTLTM